MSNRTMLELNHDYVPRTEELMEWALKMKHYLASGNPESLPRGVTWFGMRHHSEGQRVPEGYELALRRIAFMGSDCPAAMEPESFYRGQLHNCIAIAARALATPEDI